MLLAIGIWDSLTKFDAFVQRNVALRWFSFDKSVWKCKEFYFNLGINHEFVAISWWVQDIKSLKSSLLCVCIANILKLIVHIDRNKFSLNKLENCHTCHTKNTKLWMKKFPKGDNLSPGGLWTLVSWCKWSAIKHYIYLKTRFCVLLPD